MRAVPLISYERARPPLLAWAESLGDTLDVCPLPTADSWVYFTGSPGDCIKVGVTGRPNERPFTCGNTYWRWSWSGREAYPLLLISGAGRNVERLVKRAASRFTVPKHRWPQEKISELFAYASPVLELVGELRCIADACFFESRWMYAHPRVIKSELKRLRSWARYEKAIARAGRAA